MPFLPSVMGLVDVTPRMAFYGQLFLQRASNASPASKVADARETVAAVRDAVPRTSAATDSTAPILEAAAYLGEWLRSHDLAASWVSDGPGEPLLQATDETGSIAYVIPLVSVVRIASTAGYDGLAPLLEDIVTDLTNPARPCSIDEIRVQPESDRAIVTDWLHDHLAPNETSAALMRRCRSCGRQQITEIDIDEAGPSTWMRAASFAATQLAHADEACECGGLMGEQGRFLLLYDEGELGHRFIDVMMTGTHTRIASSRIHDGVLWPISE